MKKQIFSLALGLTLTVGYGHFYAHAEGTTDATDSQVVDPNSATYDTSRLIEDSVYDLTDDSAEKALLQSDYAEKRVEESELALHDGDTEQAQELINESNDSAEQATEDLNEAKTDDSKDVSDVVKQLQENTQTRVEHLTSLSAKLPQQAQEGIAKAIDNQKKALEKATAALTGESVSGDDQENQDQVSSQVNSDNQDNQGDDQENGDHEKSQSSVQNRHFTKHKEKSENEVKREDSQKTVSQDDQGDDENKSTVTKNEDGDSSTVKQDDQGDEQDKSEVSKDDSHDNEKYSNDNEDSSNNNSDQSSDENDD